MTESLSPEPTGVQLPELRSSSGHFVYKRFHSIPILRSSIEHHVIERALEVFGQHSSIMCNMIEGAAPKNIGSIYGLHGVLAHLRITFVHRT